MTKTLVDDFHAGQAVRHRQHEMRGIGEVMSPPAGTEFIKGRITPVTDGWLSRKCIVIDFLGRNQVERRIFKQDVGIRPFLIASYDGKMDVFLLHQLDQAVARIRRQGNFNITVFVYKSLQDSRHMGLRKRLARANAENAGNGIRFMRDIVLHILILLQFFFREGEEPVARICEMHTFIGTDEKWTSYFLENKELDLLEKVKRNMPSISTYANVEVGITTGANDYFTVPESVVTLYNLKEYARPMVGRSVQVNSLCFTKKDWKANVNSGAKAYLLVFPSGAKDNGNDGVRAYIENGEKKGVNNGYKTGIRDEWYIIPSIKLSDALFLRRNNLYPKFVLNEAKAYTTDTMHRVFIKEGVNKKAFVASYYNSLSFTFAEILGRNFGGGCLELMPSEVGGIYMPYRVENEALFAEIDRMLRQKRTADEILDYTDRIILHEGMGLSMEEIQIARSIWHKIMGRRLSRETLEKEEVKVEKKTGYTQLNFLDLFKQYQNNSIVENCIVREDMAEYVTSSHKHLIDESKNVLISLVKKDNFEQYLDKSAKIYYTGKKFPSKVALNKLYYFMPYLKGKGIRDLYLIKIARVGTRKEGQSGEDKNDFRLVFEIEYVTQLFDDYQLIDLKIWRTFTDTTMKDLLR